MAKIPPAAHRSARLSHKIPRRTLDEAFCVVEALLDETGECVDCRIVEANSAFKAHMEYDRVTDRRLLELAPKLDPIWCEIVGRVTQTTASERFQALLHNRFYDVFAFSIGQPDQRRVAILLNDVTKRVEIEHSLQDTNKQLEEQVAERTVELEHQNQKLRQLARQLTETEQREREALAKTLHDGLQQLLVAVKMQIRSSFEGDGEKNVKNLEGLLDEAIDASRSLSYELSPPTLQNSDLPEALRWLAEWFRTNHKFELELHAPEDFPPLERHIHAFLFFAIRELLLNAVKHSGTSRARVSLTSTSSREISVRVSDQGKGFDPEVQQDGAKLYGFGLFSIQERISALGGRMDVESIPGDGADVTLYYPTKADDR